VTCNRLDSDGGNILRERDVYLEYSIDGEAAVEPDAWFKSSDRIHTKMKAKDTLPEKPPVTQVNDPRRGNFCQRVEKVGVASL
jgi:hypothetical protein